MINDKTINIMNPARKAFESELYNIIGAAMCGDTISITKAADRLLERARQVINEE